MHRLRLVAAPAIALVIVGSGLAAAESWHEARARELILVSNAGEGRARELLEELLVFRRVLARAAPGVRIGDSVPTQIYGFRDRESMAPFLPVEERREGRASGFFRPGGAKNVIAVDLSAGAPERTLFHEYVHLVASRSGRKFPLWLEEGLAELYASTELSEDGALIGVADRRRRSALSREPLLPLEAVLEAERAEAVASEPRFYAQAWLLTHYFLVGEEGGGREALARYLARTASGAGPAEAFEAPSSAIADYARRGRFATLRVDGAARRDERVTAVRTLERGEVEHRWGELFLLTERLPEARVALENARRLEPEQGAIRETLALAALAEKDYDEARRHVEAAMELGGATPSGLYLYARAVLREHSGVFVRSIPEPIAREAERALRESLRMKPGQSEPAGLLAFVHLVRGERLREAEALVRGALLLEPNEPSLRYLEAQLLARRGEYDRARAVLLEVLRNAREPELREAASTFLSRMNEVQRAPGK